MEAVTRCRGCDGGGGGDGSRPKTAAARDGPPSCLRNRIRPMVIVRSSPFLPTPSISKTVIHHVWPRHSHPASHTICVDQSKAVQDTVLTETPIGQNWHASNIPVGAEHFGLSRARGSRSGRARHAAWWSARGGAPRRGGRRRAGAGAPPDGTAPAPGARRRPAGGGARSRGAAPLQAPGRAGARAHRYIF